MIKNEPTHPGTATTDAVEEYVRCCTMPGGIRAMLSIYRAMLVDAEQNRRAAQHPLDIPVPALGGSAFIGERKVPGALHGPRCHRTRLRRRP